MGESHLLGVRGEDHAARHLEAAGWRIVARNFRFGHREIDLIARRGRLVAFVEVKTRARLRWGHPLVAIDRRKRGEIERVARFWLERHGRRGDAFRFDAIAVYHTADGALRVEHVEDAWRM
ncbi:MAG TPA: YraN family protein [Longimicrobiales bacterium]|nr:YraN family protein [Longimicrobiales bacterium]